MTRPHRVYVGTVGNGLWRSLDGGDVFRRASDGMFVECHVRAVAVDPRDPRTLYLGNESGLYCSTDGADNWSRVDSPLNGLQIWSLLLHPAQPDTILAGTCPSRFFLSHDGGKNWIAPQSKIVTECPRILHTRVTCFAGDAADPKTLWAGVEIDGLHRSLDGGRTWQKIGSGLSSQDIHGLAVVPGPSGRRLLASTNNDLNVSEDDGVNFQPLQVGRSLPWSYCRGLAQKCGQPQVVLMGNGDGPPGSTGVVARSTDGGRTWQAAMPGRSNSTMWNFAVHAADPELIYASSVSGEVYRSTNGGATWDKLAREFGEIRALAWAPAE